MFQPSEEANVKSLMGFQDFLFFFLKDIVPELSLDTDVVSLPR